MTEVWGGAGEVAVKVNGETVGNVESSKTLGEVASQFAASHGLRTFNVLVNGSKADTSAGGSTLATLGATSVELVAKDARG